MERIGPFLVHDPIARGGMGAVYRGLHEVQQVPVAIKILHDEASPGVLRDFRNEVRSAARLDHPAIVRVLDMGVEQGHPWLAMHLIEGLPLHRSDWDHDWESVRGVLLAVLDALAHAHARRVIHRDIKPANVLTTSEGEVVLTDFGIAHAMGEAGRANLGTPAFMAPEQLAGRLRDQGPATDLYALGCLAWRGVTGRNVFEGKVAAVAAAQIQSPPPDFAPAIAVPPGLEDWLRRLLHKDPQARFAFAADAAWALSQLPSVQRRVSVRLPVAEPTPECTTLVLDPGLLLAFEPPESQPRETVAPPIPGHWIAPPRSLNLHLLGVGLGVFGLRAIPLVGRDESAEALWQLLCGVHASGGVEVCLVHGPAGVGRTRLLREITSRAHEVGAAHGIHLVVDPADGWGLGRLAARLLQVEGLRGDALLDAISAQNRRVGVVDSWEAEALAELVEPLGRVRFHRPEERFAVLRRLLMQQDRPVVLALDDITGDPDLMAFVAWLGQRGIEGHGLLVVMASRSEQLAGLPEGPTTLVLGPLYGDHRRHLVRSLLGLSGALAAQVEDRTAGNPMFAVELVGDWVQRGVLLASEEGFRLPEGEAVTIPDGAHTIWLRQVDGVVGEVGPLGLSVLEAAAALGVEVETEVLQQVCALLGAEAAMNGAIRCLIDLQLATEDKVTLRFAHAMLVESIVRRCREQGRWATINAACADALTDAQGVPRRDERLGRHYLAAERLDEARAPLLRGMASRDLAGDVRQVQALLEQLEVGLEGVSPEHADWGELLYWQALTFRRLGRLDRVEAVARELVERGTPLGWRRVSDGFVILANVARRRGELASARSILEQCLDRVPVDSDAAIWCRFTFVSPVRLFLFCSFVSLLLVELVHGLGAPQGDPAPMWGKMTTHSPVLTAMGPEGVREAFFEAFFEVIQKVLIFLVPIMTLILKVVHRGRKWTEAAVFSLIWHARTMVTVGLVAIAIPVLGDKALLLAGFAAPLAGTYSPLYGRPGFWGFLREGLVAVAYSFAVVVSLVIGSLVAAKDLL